MEAHEGGIRVWKHAQASTLDPPLQPIDYIAKELDRMATTIAVLKEKIADVAVEAEAAVAALKAKDEKIAELEAEKGSGEEGPTQAEIEELATSASTSAEELKTAAAS